jgi:kynureninase
MADVWAGVALERDALDPLRGFRARFAPLDPDVIYLAGHSVGRPPASTQIALTAGVAEWASRGAAGWHEHWVDLPRQVGDGIAGLVGAAAGEVIAGDSTSVNLAKLTAAVLSSVAQGGVIVADRNEFPSDLYVLAGLARLYGAQVRLVDSDLDHGPSVEAVRDACTGRVDLVVLSHVGYRSSAVVDMAGITEVAHDAGALVCWDLSHSAGVLPVRLDAVGADLAVGCTYKYLSGGPGSPAFLYVRRELQVELEPPIWGWFGHEDPLGMAPGWVPAADIGRWAVGSPAVLGLEAVAEGARLIADAGVDRVHAKALGLTGYAIDVVDSWPAGLGVRVASPRPRWRRGGHLALEHAAAAQVVAALADVGVMVDYRPPGRIRLGPGPLSTSYQDVCEALARLRRVLEDGAYRDYAADPGRAA